MGIIQIAMIGIGAVALALMVKQQKSEYALYLSLSAVVLILVFSMNRLQVCLIILLPESELHILGYFFHYIIRHNTEDLVGRRIQRKLISILLQCSLDLLCSFHCRFADPQVQSVRKQLTKLDPGDSSFGKQCSMLLDDCKEMRNPSFLRYNHRFSKQCSAFGSSNVKRITKFSQISE